jgi:hypothetical protein
MEKKQLTIEEQINVLKSAKAELISGKTLYTCNAVKWNLIRKLKINIEDSKECVDYIPLLTFNNALIVCRKYKLQLPKRIYAWWDSDATGRKSRLAFVNWMIKQLQAKL